MSENLHDLLSRDEIKALVEPSSARGFLSVATSYGIIAGAFVLLSEYPGAPLAWLVALVLLGGQQLALAILMHECAHRSLFKARWLNDVGGHWLCAAPIWQRLAAYRKHHLAHHSYTSRDDDPDLELARGFPLDRGSFARKVARDLLGITFARRVIGTLLMDLGYLEYTASTGARRIPQAGRSFGDVARAGMANLGPMLVTNLSLYLLLASLGQGVLYGAWALANATTFSLFLRIRSMAEHALTEVSDSAFNNARTTLASPLARLTVAPHHVNYHIEHHLLMTVPHYRLPALHRLLRERGALAQAQVAGSYQEVLRTLVGARA